VDYDPVVFVLHLECYLTFCIASMYAWNVDWNILRSEVRMALIVSVVVFWVLTSFGHVGGLQP